MKKIRVLLMSMAIAVSLAACSLPTPEEVKHSVDTYELGKISLTEEQIDEFVEPYVQILEKIKGTDKKEVKMTKEERKNLYEFCKNLTEEEFEKLVEITKKTSGEVVEKLFEEDEKSSGIDELIDAMEKEERD